MYVCLLLLFISHQLIRYESSRGHKIDGTKLNETGNVADFWFGPSVQVHGLLVCLATEWIQQSHYASAASLITSSAPNLLLTHAGPS